MGSEAGGGSLWGIITIVGPAMLALVIAWALTRNRRMSRSQERESEKATLQNKIDAAEAEGSAEAARRLRGRL